MFYCLQQINELLLFCGKRYPTPTSRHINTEHVLPAMPRRRVLLNQFEKEIVKLCLLHGVGHHKVQTFVTPIYTPCRHHQPTAQRRLPNAKTRSLHAAVTVLLLCPSLASARRISCSASSYWEYSILGLKYLKKLIMIAKSLSPK